MLEREHIVNLYIIYKGLLSKIEEEYFEYYYFEDYSLQEIADLYSVSRSYASKILNKITNKLQKFEGILKINEKNVKIKKILENIDDENIKNKIEELL